MRLSHVPVHRSPQGLPVATCHMAFAISGCEPELNPQTPSLLVFTKSSLSIFLSVALALVMVLDAQS